MSFQITDFSFGIMIFYIVLGAVIYKTFELPTKITGIVLVALTAVAMIYEMQSFNKLWILVGAVEIAVGAAIVHLYKRWSK